MSETPRSATLLALKVRAEKDLLNPNLNPQEAAARLRQLAKEAEEYWPTPAREFDRMIYRAVVITLGAVAVLSVIAASLGAPDSVSTMGAAAVGALAGLLAPSPARSGEPPVAPRSGAGGGGNT